jgi:hypothetical protein
MLIVITGMCAKNVCSECGEAEAVVDNDILDSLCSKYEYKLGMIRNIHRICAQ